MIEHRWARFILTSVIIVCLIPTAGLSRQTPFVIPSELTKVTLNPYLYVFEDSSGLLEIDDILKIDARDGFSPIPDDKGFGYSPSSFWFKLVVKYSGSGPKSWVVEYPYAPADHVELFLPQKQGFSSVRGGDRYAYEFRPIQFRTLAVPMTLLPGENIVYLNIRSSGAIVLSLKGWSNQSFERYSQLDMALNWFFFGIMASTLVYCLFIFLSMREHVFLWLGTFVFGTSIMILAHTGIGHQYFWPGSGDLSNILHPLGGFIGLVGAMLFSRLFLHTPGYSPFFDRLFKYLTALGFGMIVLLLVVPYALMTQALLVLVGISVSAMIACGVLLQCKKVRQARFYLLAWTPFAISALIVVGKSYGILERNLISDSTIQISTSIVTFLFSFGLMDKINNLRIGRERALRRVHDSERKYRMLANNVKDVIWILDLSTYRITYITPSVKDMMGYTPTEAKTMFSFDQMLPPEHSQKAKRAIQWRKKKEGKISKRNPKGFTIELEIFHKDKRRIWTETTSNFLNDRTGNIVEMIGVTRDITARKIAEKEKKALEFKLNQSGKLEAMGTLAGGIAHDMNNILSAILGYTELSITSVREGSRMHYRLSRVINASHRARDLVRQILTFSRQQSLDARTIKVSLIVKEILALIRASLPATIDIVKEIEDKDIAVNADPSQVHQIIMNLCSNAGYAMMEKGGTLKVTVERAVLNKNIPSPFPELAQGNYVRLTVSDTGQGMEKEVIDRIFDPFYTTKPVGEGTGMGLSMIHGIVKNLKGGIHVTSQSGQGSEFQVVLPMADTSDENANPVSDVNLPQGREKILYLDDEPDIVDMAQEMLEGIGYRVVGKTNSLDALSYLTNHIGEIDLLITDQTMPGMTGTELIGKAIGMRPGLPVILCTGFSEKIHESSDKRWAPPPMLFKPYDLQTLAIRVRMALDEKL